ncbi:hypothetical protein FRAHR75_120039 [Frankia sp. Hr75.2]|nr:hypothetical protein FRAHR75_120039 [Frankia sp. Hr75.2]
MSMLARRAGGEEPAACREADVLVVDENSDSRGHDLADLEKSPASPGGRRGESDYHVTGAGSGPSNADTVAHCGPSLR